MVEVMAKYIVNVQALIFFFTDSGFDKVLL